jgi:hypothetical protein
MSIGVLVWTAATLMGDMTAARSFVQQWEAAGWPTVPGVVADSASVDMEGRRGNPEIAIRYSYTVDGRARVGSRYRSDTFLNSTWRLERVARTLPAGTPVTVHYNPADPADAVLVGQIEPLDLFLFHFLVPFNCAMLVGWTYVGRAIWCRLAPASAGWASVTTRNGRTRINFAPQAYAMVPLGTLGFLFLASGLGMGLIIGGNPPWLVLAATWCLIAAVTIGICWIGGFSSGPSTRVLVLDEASRVLELPLPDLDGDAIPKPFPSIPYTAVTDVSLEMVTVDVVDEGEKRRFWSYAPTLHIKSADGGVRLHSLVKWEDFGLAQQLTDWLRKRILGDQPTA